MDNAASLFCSWSGIGPEQFPYIFGRFYKSNTAENQKGTGLGLAIAQEIAKRMMLPFWCPAVKMGRLLKSGFQDLWNHKNCLGGS